MAIRVLSPETTMTAGPRLAYLATASADDAGPTRVIASMAGTANINSRWNLKGSPLLVESDGSVRWVADFSDVRSLFARNGTRQYYGRRLDVVRGRLDGGPPGMKHEYLVRDR
jgi:hypothetical protein